MAHATPPRTPRKASTSAVKIQRAFQMSPSNTTKVQPSGRKLDPWASMQRGSSTAGRLEQPNFLPDPVAQPETPGEPPEHAGKGSTGPVNNTIRPSARMRQFLDKWAMAAFDHLLRREAGPSHSLCMRCGDEDSEARARTLYRCEDCFQLPPSCASCLVAAHHHAPFHRVDMWTDEQGFWSRTELGELGLEIRLGHGGDCCPVAVRHARPMTVVHEHGVCRSRVQFCECSDLQNGTVMPDSMQLIEYGLFGASWERPKTAFTINTLKTFHLLSLQSQLTALDYVGFLKRATDNVGAASVSDRYRELLITMREWIYLTAVRRAGLRPGRGMAPGSLAVLCPACPQPDINLSGKWKQRADDERFLDALFHTVDGNFHQNQKLKPMDPEDFPLSLGAGYFANEDEFEKFQKMLDPMELEPSTCHRFGAMGYGGYRGKVSGTVGLSCARHMFVLPSGSVDLQKGERFANVDFAMASGLKRWMSLRMHVSGYDINCQYRINFDKRMDWLAKHTKDLKTIQAEGFPPTVSAIGKFHLPAHKPSCRYKFSFHWLPGVGMTDGEAPERIWAILNAIAGSTREMTSGHRHDVINDHHSDTNVRRAHGIVKATCKKYDEARVHLKEAQRTLVTIEGQVADDTLRDWKDEERAWLKKVVHMTEHERLSNPYEPRKEAGLSQKEALSVLQTRADTGLGLVEEGMVGAISEGIELESLQAELWGGKGGADLEDVGAQSDAIQRFAACFQVWRTLYDQYVQPAIERALKEAVEDDTSALRQRAFDEMQGDEAESDEGVADERASLGKRKGRGDARKSGKRSRPGGKGWSVSGIESSEVNLPSTYARAVIDHPGMQAAVRVERLLREGQAHDALDEVKTHLITTYAVKRQKRAGSGQIHNTRANGKIKIKVKAVEDAAGRYQEARARLISLGMSTKDDTYRRLKSSDLVAFTVYSADEQLGDSRKQPSWIWSDFRFVKGEEAGIKAYCEEMLKVHWFRRSALKTRWHEEVLLLAEEMARIVRFFRYYKQWWEGRAGLAARAGEACYARKQAHRYNRLLQDAVEKFQAKLGIVL